MTILQLEIIAFVLLFLFYLVILIRECILYALCSNSMLYLDYIFQVSSCVIDEKNKFTLEFSLKEDIPDKQLRAVVVVFKKFYENGMIVSLEDEGEEFVPCFNRDSLKKIMEWRMSESAKLISGYREWDIFTKFFLKKKYQAFCEQHEWFEGEYEKISKVGKGQYFRMMSKEKG